jgi:hopene-associated glycosyltransferase HpnB
VIIESVGALSLLVWLYLLLARGGYWRVQPAAPCAKHHSAPRIVAIIPARDEAAVIGDTLTSLLRQRLEGTLHLIVVDDGSTDGTAAAAGRAAAASGGADRLTVLAGEALPSEWTGKVWAMSQGAGVAARVDPDFLLFTDADVHHEPGNLQSLVDLAESERCDLVSWMVELSVATVAEKLLIPAFVYFFFQLYPPRWVAAPRSRIAAAAGGCMLVRPAALARAGGLAAIRSALIDDCALARAIKSTGGSIRLAPTHTARSTRVYGSFGEVGRMISRSAFNQLHHSYALLTATLAGLGITYVAPPLLLLSADPAAMLLGGCAWALMCLSYAPVLRSYRLSALRAPSLPAIALFYAAATAHSALQFLLRRGGQWKGRVQDVRA